MDTFLQNPLGNPLANKPILEWFPSFGPMQFAAGGAFGHAALWGHLALGLAWAAAFTIAGLVIFRIRTRSRRHPARRRRTVAARWIPACRSPASHTARPCPARRLRLVPASPDDMTTPPWNAQQDPGTQSRTFLSIRLAPPAPVSRILVVPRDLHDGSLRSHMAPPCGGVLRCACRTCMPRIYLDATQADSFA